MASPDGYDKVLDTLGDIREKLATVSADVAWIKDQHATMCDDIDELRKYQWIAYGIAITLSMAVNILVTIIWR